MDMDEETKQKPQSARDSTGSNNLSPGRAAYLRDKAQDRINNQERKIEQLEKQVSRYNTLKLGILSVVLIVGLSNGGEVTGVGTYEFASSLIWFIIILVSMAVSMKSTVYSTNIREYFILYDTGDNFDDEFINKLYEAESVKTSGEVINLKVYGERIAENKNLIDNLNYSLRYIYMLTYVILFTILIIGLPSYAISIAIDLFAV